MFVLTTSVYVIVRHHYTLLIRRSATDPTKPNWWEVPGGHVDIASGIGDERILRQEALRELEEEAGIKASPSQLREIDLSKDFSHKTYALDLSSKPAVRLSKEHDKFMWWEPNRPFPSPIRPQVVEKLG